MNHVKPLEFADGKLFTPGGLGWMRVSILIALFGCGAAFANPSIDFPERSPEYEAYIESENLVATISLTNVSFEGTFTFAFVQNSPDGSRTPSPTYANVLLRLWLPKNKRGVPYLEKFWKGFERLGTDCICDDALDEAAFERSIALRVRCKDPALLPLSTPLEMAPEAHWFTDSKQGGSNRFFDCQAMNRPDWMTTEEAPKWGWNPDFCLLCFRFRSSASVVTHHYPVTVFYQHPLVHSNGEGRFFYLPNFDNLPSAISTADTNRYSITIRATPDCCLTVTTGEKIIIPPPKVVESGHATVEQTFTVQGGQSITMAPQDFHPIRATSRQTPPLGQ